MACFRAGESVLIGRTCAGGLEDALCPSPLLVGVRQTTMTIIWLSDFAVLKLPPPHDLAPLFGTENLKSLL